MSVELSIALATHGYHPRAAALITNGLVIPTGLNTDWCGGTDWAMFQRGVYRWAVAGSCLDPAKIMWGQQEGPRNAAPAVSMKIATVDPMGRPFVTTCSGSLGVAPMGVTASGSTDRLTRTAHGLLTGDGPLRISSTGTLPGGLSEDTDYWVIRRTDDAFWLASSYIDALDGLRVDLTSDGTGTLVVQGLASTRRVGEEIKQTSHAWYRVAVVFEAWADKSVGRDSAIAILQRIHGRSARESQLEILEAHRIGFLEAMKIRWVRGVRDAVLFEPRAVMEVHFCVTFSESEYLGIIESTEITQLSPEPAHSWVVDANDPPPGL